MVELPQRKAPALGRALPRCRKLLRLICSVLHCYWMLAPLFRGKTQLQLEAHAAQDVARAVANRDRVMRAIIE
jgi:hypothetical protein